MPTLAFGLLVLTSNARAQSTAGSDGAAEWTGTDLRDLLFRQGRDRRPISGEHEIARANGVNWHKGRSQKDVADFMCHGPLHAIVGDRAGRQLCSVPGASVVSLLLKLINDEDCNIGIGNGVPSLCSSANSPLSICHSQF